jgi:hypothetical protein
LPLFLLELSSIENEYKIPDILLIILRVLKKQDLLLINWKKFNSNDIVDSILELDSSNVIATII